MIILGSIQSYCIRDCFEILHPDLWGAATRHAASRASRLSCSSYIEYTARRAIGGSEDPEEYRAETLESERDRRDERAREGYIVMKGGMRKGKGKREEDTGTYDYTPSRTIMVARPYEAEAL